MHRVPSQIGLLSQGLLYSPVFLLLVEVHRIDGIRHLAKLCLVVELVRVQYLLVECVGYTNGECTDERILAAIDEVIDVIQ